MSEDHRSIIHMRIDCDSPEAMQAIIDRLARPAVAISGAGISVSGAQEEIVIVGGHGVVERKGKPKGKDAAPAVANDAPQTKSPA